jgi:hypothetical protein
MLSILVVTDLRWDNYAIINKRISSINNDFIINMFYSLQTGKIANMCSDNMIRFYRKYLDINDVNNSIKNEVCNNIDVVIIFSNRTEINTISNYVIHICEQNNIKHFIFSESFTGFIYDDIYYESKFKSLLNKIIRRNKETIKDTVFPEIVIKNEYVPSSVQECIKKIRKSYSTHEEDKRRNAISLLYDKEHTRKLKNSRKQEKEISYLEYRNRRSAWLKEIVPKS